MKILEGKVVLLGAQGVGKTSLLGQYVAKKFSTNISPTIGASFFTCAINIGRTRVKLQIWDTAGQERFRSMAPMYYRNANAALLMFDVTNYQSFNAVKTWVKELQSNINEPIVLSVIGNKIDLESSRQVQNDEASQYAQSINAQYYETSVLRDQGIEQMFLNTATELIKLSGESVNTSLKSYDYESLDYEEDLIPSANCTTLHATDIGKTETPPWSIDSIAHADSEKPYMCC